MIRCDFVIEYCALHCTTSVISIELPETFYRLSLEVRTHTTLSQSSYPFGEFTSGRLAAVGKKSLDVSRSRTRNSRHFFLLARLIRFAKSTCHLRLWAFLLDRQTRCYATTHARVAHEHTCIHTVANVVIAMFLYW